VAFTITLGARHACVTPAAHWHARAEGGYIDVPQATPNVLAVNLTGTAAANSHLGGTSSASEAFQLVQEFEITCSDPSASTVVLTLDSALVGFVRSKHKAGACIRLADACVRPASRPGSPLKVVHSPLCASGTQGRLCNQHLPPIEGPPMPLGKYVLVANFVIDATAGGLCDAHAVADLSPDTQQPADRVRMRDPFQGVAKKVFGDYLNLTAAAPTEGAGPS
jgi:hypothetical protein